MNISNNVDYYSGSGSMNECYHQRGERLPVADDLRHFFNSAQSTEAERCPITFRSMNEHRTKESNKGFKSCAIENVNVDVEDTKVPPYQYTRPRSYNNVDEQREIVVKRPCMDDVLAAPPTVLPTASSVVQDDAEYFHYTERQKEPIFHRNLIEVGNDMVPLAGVDESSLAHKKGYTIDTACVECNTVLFCLETSSMVVCPYCRCVSPIESSSKEKATIDVHAGIGLPIDFVIALA